MVAVKCSYQTKLPWKMGSTLQCRINTSMFFAIYWQPCLAYTVFFMGSLFGPTDIFLAVTIRFNFLRHETPQAEQIQKWL
jgi:hypothetical protein